MCLALFFVPAATGRPFWAYESNQSAIRAWFKSDVFWVTLRTLIGPAFERVHAGHSFLASSLSSARKACIPRAPASARAVHPSTVPWDSFPRGGGARSVDTAGGSGRTGAT